MEAQGRYDVVPGFWDVPQDGDDPSVLEARVTVEGLPLDLRVGRFEGEFTVAMGNGLHVLVAARDADLATALLAAHMRVRARLLAPHDREAYAGADRAARGRLARVGVPCDLLSVDAHGCVATVVALDGTYALAFASPLGETPVGRTRDLPGLLSLVQAVCSVATRERARLAAVFLPEAVTALDGPGDGLPDAGDGSKVEG